MMDGPPTTTSTIPSTTQETISETLVASETLSFTAFKESGLDRDRALADCQSRGQRLANVYNEDQQAAINALITSIDGTDRAFWLGMIEDGDIPDKNGIKVKHIESGSKSTVKGTITRPKTESNIHFHQGPIFKALFRIQMASLLVITMDGELINHRIN